MVALAAGYGDPMEKVLVTGADGFIGSHLVEALVREGFLVRGLAMYNSLGSYGWMDESPVLGDVEMVLGDIRDSGTCDDLTQGVDTVYHLAALIGIPYSYRAPRSYVDTNVHGTVNMCSAALRSGVSCFIHTSTSEVYGSAITVPISEGHPLQPQSPYSASKIAADALARSYHLSFDLPVVVARPFNTYGPRQSARAIIPSVVAQLMQGCEVLKVGDTRPTRDLNYVADTVGAFMSIARTPECVGETLNMGSGVEISIAHLIRRIQDLLGTDVAVAQEQERLRPESSEVTRLVCDSSRLTELTGFRSGTSLDEGLAETLAWFREERNLERYVSNRYVV